MEINDPTHLTGHVCVDASRDEEKYQGFALSGCPEEDRRGDRQRLCVDIYLVAKARNLGLMSNRS